MNGKLLWNVLSPQRHFANFRIYFALSESIRNRKTSLETESTVPQNSLEIGRKSVKPSIETSSGNTLLALSNLKQAHTMLNIHVFRRSRRSTALTGRINAVVIVVVTQPALTGPALNCPGVIQFLCHLLTLFHPRTPWQLHSSQRRQKSQFSSFLPTQLSVQYQIVVFKYLHLYRFRKLHLLQKIFRTMRFSCEPLNKLTWPLRFQVPADTWSAKSLPKIFISELPYTLPLLY